MKACEVKEVEQMERLYFCWFHAVIHKVNHISSCVAALFIIFHPCLFCSCVLMCQTQAEAHYKGHKHARKLKALETQRNRHKSGRSPSMPGKVREQDTAKLGGGTLPTDSHLKYTTGINHSVLLKANPLFILWVIRGNLRDINAKAW